MSRRSTLVSIVLFTIFVGASIANAQTYSGQATAVRSSVRLLNLPAVQSAVNDTGPLPRAGGSIDLASANTNIADILTAGASTVSTSGGIIIDRPTPLPDGTVNTSQSFASVFSLDTAAAGFAPRLRVRADAVRSDTNCDCGAGACSGFSTITNLRIGRNPTPVVVTGEVNQVVTSTFGNVTLRIVLNEAIFSLGNVTVNALHITLTNSTTGTVTDIVVSSSHSDITCTTSLSSDRFSGRATGVRLDQFTLIPTSSTSLIVSDTGYLPSFGGIIGPVTTASTNVPGILTTGVVTSNTSGGVIIDRPAPLPDGTADTSQSDSTVNNLNVTLLPGPNVVTISGTNTTLQSNTQCACGVTDTSSCAGDSVIQNLEVRIGGVLVATINGTSAPNTVIPLVVPVVGTVLGSITLNEQTSASSGDITVNALHVRLSPLGLATTDLIVASSYSDIQCGVTTTAADVSIAGRVVDANGRGLSNARVTALGMDGTADTALTNSFGYYRIDNLDSARSYVVSVKAKRLIFQSRVVSMTDNLEEVDFAPVQSSVQK